MFALFSRPACGCERMQAAFLRAIWLRELNRSRDLHNATRAQCWESAPHHLESPEQLLRVNEKLGFVTIEQIHVLEAQIPAPSCNFLLPLV